MIYFILGRGPVSYVTTVIELFTMNWNVPVWETQTYFPSELQQEAGLVRKKTDIFWYCYLLFL